MNEIEKQILFKKIDQIHNATLNFSKASIQMKQIMFTLAAITAPIVVKLAGDKLDLSLFITLYLIIIVFHFLDSFTYYYQKKLRAIMDFMFTELKENNQLTAETEKTKKEKSCLFMKNIWKSVYNWSTAIYVCLFILNTIALILYLCGIIG